MGIVTTPHPETSASEVLSLLRRRWKLLAASLVLGAILGVAALWLAPVSYASTTSVLILPTGADTNNANGRTNAEINLDTEAQLVKSLLVAGRAAESLRTDLSPRDLVKKVRVGVPPNTSVLTITFTAGSPEAAQRGSAAFATAYLDNRRAVAEGRVQEQTESLRERLKALNEQLRETTTKLQALSPGSEQALLSTERDLLVQQIRTTTQKLGPLAASSINPGTVITEAQLPTTPAGINRLVVITTALFLCLALGLCAAWARDRNDRRIRTPRDLTRLGLENLVGTFGLTIPDRFLHFRHQSAEPLRQMRNALLAVIPEHRGSIAVASVSPGTSGATTAASLASTLARSGVDTILVSANTHTDVIAEQFGLVGETGLADVLRSGRPLIETVHHIPGMPGLHVVPAGADGALFSQLLQDSTIEPILRHLEALAEVVVLDLAPTSVNADAQTVAPATVGSLLVTTAGVTTADEFTDAVTQLRHVNAPILGTVIIEGQHPYRRRRRGEQGATANPPWSTTLQGPRLSPRSDEPHVHEDNLARHRIA